MSFHLIEDFKPGDTVTSETTDGCWTVIRRYRKFNIMKCVLNDKRVRKKAEIFFPFELEHLCHERSAKQY
jgi:hypothetical protein